jgi:hypothetical protein
MLAQPAIKRAQEARFATPAHRLAAMLSLLVRMAERIGTGTL